MKTISALSIVVLFALLFCSQPASAVGSNSTLTSESTGEANTPQEKRLQNINQAKDQKEQLKEKRCEMLTNRLENRVQTYTAHREQRVAEYARIRERLGQVNQVFNKYGCTSPTVTEDLNTFDSLVKEFSNTYQTFVQTLEQTRTQACSENTAAYASTAKRTQEQLRLVREKAAQIRNFYTRSMRLHINTARSECKATQETDKPATQSSNLIKSQPIKEAQ